MVRYLLLSMAVLSAVTACSARTLTVDEVDERVFATTDEVAKWLGCDDQWIATPDPANEIGLNSAPHEVVTAVREYVGSDFPHLSAIRSGGVWLLADADGRVFGSVQPGRELLWCSASGSVSFGD